MKEFIESIKRKRLAEIQTAVSKGYICSPFYKFFDTFEVQCEQASAKIKYSLFANGSEVWFLTMEEQAVSKENKIKYLTTYLSIVSLFDKISYLDKEHRLPSYFCDTHSFHKLKIIYDNSVFFAMLPTFSDEIFDYIDKLNNGLMEYIILLALIQGKSNTFFEKQKEYLYGLYRFYYVYCLCEIDHNCLESRGWKYNMDEHKYKYSLSLAAKAIILKYDLMINGDECERFKKSIERVKDNKNKVLKRFLDEYNRINSCKIAIPHIYEWKQFEYSSNDLSNKEINKIINLKSYKLFDSGFYTMNGFSYGINKKEFILLLDKTNKKYYLTENELDEIIKMSPREKDFH